LPPRRVTPPPDRPPKRPAPPVAYDALFRLPSGSATQPKEGAQPDRKRWEERFAAVRGDLDNARQQLAKSQADLEALAHKSDSWQMAAPGAQPNSENSPVSYKLSQDIRKHREEVGRAERRLRELEVEASLAGVPPEWREPAVHTDATPGS
jgi:chromosome segregation ATPase